jgi:hypothetical protein
MVETMKPVQRRITKYAEGLDPRVIYLYVKKQRHKGDVAIGITTLKDEAINPILIPYDLDARFNQLALIAWRELYFMKYKTKQTVVLHE